MMPQDLEYIAAERTRFWEARISHMQLLSQIPSQPPVWRLWLGDGIPYDDYVHTMFEIALGLPEFAPTVPLVWNRMYGHVERNTNFPDIASLIAGSVSRYSVADRVQELTYQMIGKAYDCWMSSTVGLAMRSAPARLCPTSRSL